MNSTGMKSPPKTSMQQTPSSPTGKTMKTSLSMDAGKELTSVTTSTSTAAAHGASVTQASGTAVGRGRPHLPLSATASLNVSGSGIGVSTISGSHSARPGPTPTPLPRMKRLSKRASVESKVTPRRNYNKLSRKEVTDVQQMEQGLLKLLDDFHSGKLQAFGKDCSFQKMDNVREQQERLARLHFELGSQQEVYGTLSEEGQAIAKDNLAKLMLQLQELSTAIEQLQSSTTNSGLQTEV